MALIQTYEHLVTSTYGLTGQRKPQIGERKTRAHLGFSLGMEQFVRVVLILLTCPRHWKKTYAQEVQGLEQELCCLVHGQYCKTSLAS